MLISIETLITCDFPGGGGGGLGPLSPSGSANVYKQMIEQTTGTG